MTVQGGQLLLFTAVQGITQGSEHRVVHTGTHKAYEHLATRCSQFRPARALASPSPTAPVGSALDLAWSTSLHHAAHEIHVILLSTRDSPVAAHGSPIVLLVPIMLPQQHNRIDQHCHELALLQQLSLAVTIPICPASRSCSRNCTRDD